MTKSNGVDIITNNMSISEQKEYYNELRRQCLSLNNNQVKIGQDIIKRVYPLLRKYKIEPQGEENIPKDTNVLFVANHSNSHDIFTAYEVFSLLKRRGSVMVATDCLNPLTIQIFNISNATLLDRRNKSERNDSVLLQSKKLIDGYDGLIFGESTWNIHPTLPMHNIRNGSAKISLVAQVPVVPVIFEYIETNDMVTTESQLFDKCIIRFGKPIMIDYTTLSSQSENIKENMAMIRKQIWKDYGIVRESIDDIDPQMYINHTYAKKFKALGFTYDSKMEQEYLLFLNGEPRENEYTINENGEFVPGITEKKSKLRKLLNNY